MSIVECTMSVVRGRLLNSFADDCIDLRPCRGAIVRKAGCVVRSARRGTRGRRENQRARGLNDRRRYPVVDVCRRVLRVACRWVLEFVNACRGTSVEAWCRRPPRRCARRAFDPVDEGNWMACERGRLGCCIRERQGFNPVDEGQGGATRFDPIDQPWCFDPVDQPTRRRG